MGLAFSKVELTMSKVSLTSFMSPACDSAGEIRCYCDAPHCVSTGYMCKSEANACFTRLLEPFTANSPLTHGCLDPAADASDACAGHSRGADTPAVAALECCHDDMCNYRGLQELAHTRDAAGKETKKKQLEVFPTLRSLLSRG